MIVDLPEDPAVTADRVEWTIFLGALRSAEAQMQVALDCKTDAGFMEALQQAQSLVDEVIRLAELR